MPSPTPGGLQPALRFAAGRFAAVLLVVTTIVVTTFPAIAQEPGPATVSPTAPPATAPTAPSPSVTAQSDTTTEQGPLADPYRPQQWYLDRLGLTEDRMVPTGAGEVVAIVDSGVDLAHPDLVEAFERDASGAVVGWDWVDGDAEPDDEFGHGTMVAGIVGARAGNGLGIAGVAPGVTLMPLRVLDDRGEGPTSAIADAVDFAVANGATVINLSLESATAVGVERVPAVIAAIERAVAAGIVVIAAAGNTDEPLSDFAPELGVVVVGATDRDDRRAGFSDGGRVDLVMAPGVGIVSTWCRGEGAPTCDGTAHTFGVADGTSFAAPQVAGLVAMLRSTGLTGAEAVARIKATAIDLGPQGPDPETGVGLATATAALGPWPDPIPVPATPVPEPSPQASEPVIPAESVPDETVVAELPTSLRLVLWGVVALIALAIAIVGRGVVAHRRVRPHAPVPHLRHVPTIGAHRPGPDDGP